MTVAARGEDRLALRFTATGLADRKLRTHSENLRREEEII
jgi:hypothetical protein